MILSNIGQTYGAASALVSVLALVGVAFSLIVQSREAKATREQAMRALHADLIKMAMDDPLYRACWGAFFTSEDEDNQRAHMYVNMIVNHWLLMWELRSITEPHLRAVARTVIEGPIGRKFWEDVRDLRIASAGTRREREFNRIIDSEYVGMAEITPAVQRPARQDGRSFAPDGVHARNIVDRTFVWRILVALGAGLAFGVIRRILRARPKKGNGKYA
ncbi:hypothetical protein GCM10009555_015960 [Acrocarpospora macrocephala]|uniref:Uncharacterized protein n=2 Tax=Acrocarpospora macrocephala TaxID=150177 RepID=A0A5M3X3U4_9ACTN|nr:hypothetical protein Amac_094020 [Acrocarpospora macrocephala]